ncbi:MAG: isochorismate synthase [Pseudoclavibacter sp.]|nr:isochorismate synthase [Pseudoclavibacter sp.]
MAAERFWFASPAREFFGEGVRERYDGPLTPPAVTAARERLAPGEVLIGWLPFEPGGPGALVRPERLRTGPGAGEPGADPSEPRDPRAGAPGGRVPHESVPRESYLRAVGRALERIGAGELEKVVLARAVELPARGVDPFAAMREARRRDPRVHAFAYDTGLADGPEGLFGASPELLVRRTGPLVASLPLAGSRPRRPEPEADRAQALELLASEKDRTEHAVVVRHIAEVLRGLCARVIVPAEPSLVATETMWHLASSVQGVLEDPATSVVELAAALHPTPAICGAPVAAALAEIRAAEPLERGLYAGATGWCDRAGDGEWAVTLRAGQRLGERLLLHAGAGVVAGSEPEAEWEETAAKLRTMERALGAADPLETCVSARSVR